MDPCLRRRGGERRLEMWERFSAWKGSLGREHFRVAVGVVKAHCAILAEAFGGVEPLVGAR